MPADDPLRLILVVRRGGVDALDAAAELAGAAAVACLRAFADDPALPAWRERPGKVCLRARSPAQWDEVLQAPHVLAGDAVAAFPPRRRSDRDPIFDRLQAMATALDPPPERPGPDPRRAVTYLLNPAFPMSSGKVLAQVAHAAVAAAETDARWVADGCPGRLVIPDAATFAAACARPGLAARIQDAGFTEVPPGTVTVVAYPAAPCP